MTEREEIYGYIHEIISRANGKDPEEPSYPTIPIDPPRQYDYLDELAALVEVGRVPEGTRFSFPKRAFMRMVRTFSAQQREFNRATVTALHALAADREHRFVAAQAGIAGVELIIRELREQLLEIRQELEALRGTEKDEGRVRQA